MQLELFPSFISELNIIAPHSSSFPKSFSKKPLH